MNTLVDFETAKLLKEKGFDLPCNTHCFIGNTNKIVFETSVHCIDWGNRPNIKTVQKYSAPTIAEVVMWLYKKYGIWITPLPITKNKWYWEILHSYEENKGWSCMNDSNEFNSPREASFKAINYTLNILIPKTK